MTSMQLFSSQMHLRPVYSSRFSIFWKPWRSAGKGGLFKMFVKKEFLI